MSGGSTVEREGDALVGQILGGEGAPPGRVLNELASAFWRGYPIERLRPLLRHRDEQVLRAAVFLADELPGVVRPVIDDVIALMGHESGFVRGWSGRVVGANVVDDGPALARALMMLADPDAFVRWHGFHVALHATHEQLRLASRFLEADARAALLASGLVGPLDDAQERWGVLERVICGCSGLRLRWAVVTAARLNDRGLLSRAIGSREPEVAEFASRALEGVIRLRTVNHRTER